jgi:hypothetical protein
LRKAPLALFWQQQYRQNKNIMKKIFVTGVLLAFLGLTTPSQAQETKKESTPAKVKNSVKSGAKKAWKGTKKGAKTVGNETAELATKAKAKATDSKSTEWLGPNGQAIYIDDGNKYYWINEKGGREFVTKDQLKPKNQ